MHPISAIPKAKKRDSNAVIILKIINKKEGVNLNWHLLFIIP